MLEESIHLATGRGRVLAHVEWEAFAAATLLARMEEQSLEPAPVWCGDLRDFPGQPFRGLVDILCAGLPCQPYSLAGKRQGNDDKRSWGADGDSGPLPATLRLIETVQPALVFLENVPAWVSSGWFRPFGESLCGLGYELEEPLFLSASDVGACHGRERVFILAHRAGSGRAGQLLHESAGWLTDPHALRTGGEVDDTHGGRLRGQSQLWDKDGTAPTGGELGNTPSEGRRRQQECQSRCQEPDRGPNHEVADTGRGQLPQPGRGEEGRDGAGPAVTALADSAGLHGQCEQQPGESTLDQRAGPSGDGAELADPEHRERREHRDEGEPESGQATARRSGELAQPSSPGLPQPQPAAGPAAEFRSPQLFAPGPQSERWQHIVSEQPHLSPAIEPGLCLLADGVAYVVDEARADQLRCAGNGVVAIQGAFAFVHLARLAAQKLNPIPALIP